MKNIILASLLFVSTSLLAQKNTSVSFEKWISLKAVGSPVISPDGKTIVYTVTSTDWANNAYDSELCMAFPNPNNDWQPFGITGNGLTSMFLEKKKNRCRWIKE
jgi:hypothetical protein